ncbi:hypothetical protein ACLESO_25865 [Pyxidicoccus sp. 3LG]
MVSTLQTRLRQLSTAFVPPAQPPKVSTKPSPDATSVPQAAKPQNTALRTIAGDSVFEPAQGKAGEKVGRFFDKLGPLEKTTPEEQRREAVEAAIAGNGRPTSFVNSDGKTEQVAIAQVPFFGEDTYFVRVGDETFRVEFEGGTDVDREEFLAQVIDSYSETPPELRGSLETIVVTPDKGPTTATGGSAAASAGDGRITFYEDGIHLSEDIFHHELAHLIGRQQEEKGDGFFTDLGEIFGEPPPVPDGWDEAVESDGNFVSDYAEADYDKDGNYTEDFADSWAQYMRARDEGPEALAEFKEQYPERAELLEELYSEG